MVKEWMITSLPETAYEPSALSFAKCFLSITWQRSCVPSASQKNSWQTINTRQINLLPSVTWEALGKEEHVPHTCDGHAMAGARPWQLLVLLPSAHYRHLAKLGLSCAFFFTHLANMKLCRVSSRAHGKLLKRKSPLATKLLLLFSYYTCYYMFKFGIFVNQFAIFS